MNPFLIVILKFWYTIVIIFIFSRFLYFPNRGRKEYFFSNVLMGAIIFMICILIRRAELSLGFALGIFAVFGIIRYRTLPINPREMTYLFLCAGIAAKNSLMPNEVELYKVLISDLSLLFLAWLCEYYLFRGHMIHKTIIYNRLDLIHPEKRNELMADLHSKYGITEVKKIKVGKIDAVKSSVTLSVDFYDRNDAHLDEV